MRLIIYINFLDFIREGESTEGAFISAWRSPFSIPCKACLDDNFFIFCLSGSSLLILKDILLSILGWQSWVPSSLWHCSGDGAYEEIVSQLLLPTPMWVFLSLTWWIGVTWLVSGFPLEGIILYTACRHSVSTGGAEFRSLLSHHLLLEPIPFFFFFNLRM